MRIDIVDSEALAAISPSSVSAFARSLGWTHVRDYRGVADIYQNKDRDLQTIVPRSWRISDYSQMVGNLLTVFSEQLKKDQDEIYRSLIDADNDVFRARAFDGDDDGTIGIEEGVELISQAREAVLAAACSALNAQAVFRAGANREATEFLRTIRLGQTNHGSYIVNLLNRVPPNLQPSLLDHEWSPFEEEPIERKVSRKFADAMRAMEDATEQVVRGGDIETFEEKIGLGVSANLCEAIAKMITSASSLEISVNWAMTRPAPVPSETVKFSEDDAVILKEAGRALRAKRPLPNRTVFGAVHKLARDPAKSDGIITLKADVDGITQSISAALNDDNYQIAVRAHGSKDPVVVTGDLERKGQRWHMVNPSIRVIDTGADDDEDESQGID